jgi:hypothetical protein
LLPIAFSFRVLNFCFVLTANCQLSFRHTNA